MKRSIFVMMSSMLLISGCGSHTAESDEVIQSLITADCKNLAGRTFTLNVISTNGYSYYQGRDGNGVTITVDSHNYGQWNCKDVIP